MRTRRAPRLGLAAALALALSVSAAAATEEGKPRALTDLDDALACLPLDGGVIAVATGGGLAIVAADGSVRTLTALDGLPDTRVHALALDGDALWVGTDTGAARVRLAPTLQVTRTVALGNAAVHAVLATASGVYLGTWGSGLVHLQAQDAAPELVRTSVTGKHIAALADSGGSVYVAYADGPLARLEGGVLTAVPGTPSHGQALASVARAGAGAELVLGDLEGLYRVGQGVAPMAPVDARGVATSGSQLLVATYGAGLLAGPASGALHRESIVPRFTRGVAVRGTTRCVATTEGVYVDADARGWKKLTLGALPSNDVTALEALGARVAVGTFENGAAIVEGASSQRVAGLEPTETVNALAWQGEGDRAILWLGTAHGVVRVAPGGGVRRLRAADGLPSSVVRALVVLPDGRLLVGTDEGPAYVQGDRVEPLAPLPKGPAPLASPMHATWARTGPSGSARWRGSTRPRAAHFRGFRSRPETFVTTGSPRWWFVEPMSSREPTLAE